MNTWPKYEKVPTAAEAWRALAEARRHRRLERSTIRQYRSHVEQHINPLLGAVKLSRLTAPAVQDFVDRLLETKSSVTNCYQKNYDGLLIRVS